MAPVKSGDRSELIYSTRRAMRGLHRCSDSRDRCENLKIENFQTNARINNFNAETNYRISTSRVNGITYGFVYKISCVNS